MRVSIKITQQQQQHWHLAKGGIVAPLDNFVGDCRIFRLLGNWAVSPVEKITKIEYKPLRIWHAPAQDNGHKFKHLPTLQRILLQPIFAHGIFGQTKHTKQEISHWLENKIL